MREAGSADSSPSSTPCASSRTSRASGAEGRRFSRRRFPVRLTSRRNSIVQVPLANAPGRFATLDADDFDRLREAGVSDQWTLNGDGHGNAYVRVAIRTKGRLVSVARLIVGAPAGRVVKYYDGNRTNLRRRNLTMKEGYARKAVQRG